MVSKKFLKKIEEKKKINVKELKKEGKRLKKLGQKPKVKEGEIDYRWCNVANILPIIDNYHDTKGNVIERYSGKRRVI